MMEFSKVQIAGLVLGYLKSEKCMNAYEEFLNSSSHLIEARQVVQKGKYFVTRIYGLSLEDFLHEYAKAYTLVNGYLEASDYYEGNHKSNSLSDQITYLLEKRGSIPVTSSPFHSRSERISVSDRATNTIDSELNATLASSLPGNIDDDKLDCRSSRRKGVLTSKLHKSADDAPVAVLADESVSKVLTQTLLDNKELHEKLAETINIVRNTPEIAAPATQNQSIDKDVSDSAEKQLDATIKTVVQRTEEDPIFSKLLNDLIGIGVVDEGAKKKHTTPDHSNSTKSLSADTPDKGSTEKNSTDAIRNQQSPGKNIDELNYDAVQSIIAVASTSESSGSANVDHNNFTKTSNAATITTQNPIYLNAGGGLYLMPPAPGTQQIYLLNSQSMLNMSMAPVTAAPVLTEEDIMSMPTVIVNDDLTSSVVLPATSGATVKQGHQKSYKKIVPRPRSLDKSKRITLYNETTKTEITAPLTRSKTCSSSMPVVDDDNSEKKATKKKPSSVKNTEPSRSTKTPEVKQSLKSKTPKSGSHIRNLDFSSPRTISKRKDPRSAKIRQNISRKSASKNLFRSKNEKSEAPKQVKPQKSWDADLRGLVGVLEDDGGKTTSKTDIPKQTHKKAGNREKTESSLNTTYDEALMLEAALKTPVKNEESSEVDSNKKNIVKKNINNGREKSPEKINDQKEQEQEEEEEEESENTHMPMLIDSDMKMKYSLRNCNSGPNFRKKCNLNSDNSKKGKVAPDKTKTEKQSVEDGAKNLLLLSPSKLNASKRNLVKSDNFENSPGIINTEIFSETSDEIIEATRNPSPVLETPVKLMIPKTPNIQSCLNASITPFSKVLEEQLKGIDLSSLPTPKLPITPNFPLTPCVDLISTTYSNRPTDYSNSSSYYQPSDTEQNKSLEQVLIEETNRLTKIDKKGGDSSVKILSNVVIGNTETKESEKVSETENRLAEHLRSFNQSVIGKKNLNLVKQNISSSSSSSSSSEDETSSSSESESSCDKTCCSKQNFDTKDDDSTPCSYSLRNRSISKKSEAKSTEATVEVKNDVKEKILGNKNLKNSQKSILLELEEKRKRTVDKFKSTVATTSKVSVTKVKKKPLLPKPDKQKHTKPQKSLAKKKPSPNKQNKKSDNDNVKDQIAVTKLVKKSELLTTETENTDEDIVLHLSSDDENDDTLQPSSLVETQLMEYSNSPQTNTQVDSSISISREHDEGGNHSNKTDSETIAEDKAQEKNNENKASDQDAEKLVNELKERGIHLMHKKSPVKKNECNDNVDNSDKTRVHSADNGKNEKIEKITNDSKINDSKSSDETKKSDKNSEETTSNHKDDNQKLSQKISNKTEKSSQKISNKTEKSSQKISDKIENTKENETGETKQESKSKDDSTTCAPNQSEVQETNVPERNESMSDLEKSFNSSTDVTFDLKVYEKEDFSFVYKDTEKHKNIEDYDLSLIHKCISANVYLEELDQEMVRKMYCSPFISLLDISATKDVLLLKRKRRFEATEDRSCSGSKIDLDDAKVINDKNSSKSESKSDLQSQPVMLGDSIEVKKVESSKFDAVTNSEIQSSTSLVENMEIVDGVIISNSEATSEITEQEDDLMNYAIVGSVREESPEDSVASPKGGKKRKASNGDEDKNSDKKIKTEHCKELIKKIDVDVFLNKVHGGDKHLL